MRALCTICTLLFLSGKTCGLTIELSDAINGQLPVIEYPIGNGPLRITADIRNEAGQLSDPVLLWQIGFVLLPIGDVSGTIVFADLGPPADPLFGLGSQPLSLSELQGNFLVATDVDPAFTGVAIDGNTAGSILELKLQASQNAAGSFLLAAVPYDPTNVDQTSFWGRPDEQLFEFQNPIGESQFIELGTVNVASGFSTIGDYNADGEVDAADYTTWRDGLDGTFQAEHYDIWRSHYGETAAGLVSATSIPEGISLLVLPLALPFVRIRRGLILPS